MSKRTQLMPSMEFTPKFYRFVERVVSQLITEITATPSNIEKFQAKYGDTLSDEEIKDMFDNFTKRQSGLEIQDIFGYRSLKALQSILKMPTVSEMKKVLDSKGNVRPQQNKLAFRLLRQRYGEILDEDIEDIVDSYNQINPVYDLKNIFEYEDLTELKKAITAGVPATPIDSIPDDVEGAKTVYQDKQLYLVRIKNYDRSREYCQNVGGRASWCIGLEHTDQWWVKYHENDQLEFVFLLTKDGEKYAITYNDNAYEIYDRADNLYSMVALVRQYPQIVKPLQSQGVPVKNYEEYDLEDDGKGYVVDEVFTGLGGLSGTITSYLTYEYKYRDAKKDKSPAIKTPNNHYIWYKAGKPWKETGGKDDPNVDVKKEYLPGGGYRVPIYAGPEDSAE